MHLGLSLRKIGVQPVYTGDWRSVMRSKDTFSSNRLPTLFHYLCLFCNIGQTRNHLLVTIDKSEDGIRNLDFAAELSDKFLGFSKIVTRDSRKEMMNCLELETSMEKI